MKKIKEILVDIYQSFVFPLIQSWNSWRKQQHCDHDFTWKFNYYGDQIIYNGYNRSAWKCEHCNAWINRSELMPDKR